MPRAWDKQANSDEAHAPDRPTPSYNVTIAVSYWMGSLFAGDRFKQGIEVFQPGVFDDHAAATVLIFNRYF